MRPELTQSRTCRRCGKALPIELRSDAIYCPDRKGERRCRTKTKASQIKQLEPWERKSIQERATIQRCMPEGAIGYRISFVRDDSLYLFPKLGSNFHYDAYGQRVKGGYFRLHELPRVPLSAVYKIEYIGADGSVLDAGACFMELSRTPRGRCTTGPNPTSRQVSAALLMGEPLPGSIRLSQLASHLGLSLVELVPLIGRCGIRALPHGRATISGADCARITAEYQREKEGARPNGPAGARPGVQEGGPSAVHEGMEPSPIPMIVMTTPAALEDDFRIIQRKMDRVAQELADATAAGSKMIEAATECTVSTGTEADRLSGIAFPDQRLSPLTAPEGTRR